MSTMQLGKSGAIGGLIVFGTTTSLFAKIVYELQSKGSNGEIKYFHKPWAMTSIMFIGMSFCLPLAYYQERRKKRVTSVEEEPLLGGGQVLKRNHLKETLMLSIPTFFDLLATVLMNVGLLWVTASVYQMMRGAEMLFAAFFAVTFLKRKLNRHHMIGLLCCLVGVMMVGTSSLLSGEGSATQVISQEQMMVGISLIVISQAVQAAQLTFEDFFMADMDIAPMKIVGYEGVFGMVGTLLIMAPIAYYLKGTEGQGVHEDIVDTWVMISNSRQLQVILLIDMVALLLYNISGMMVTCHIGAVFRTVLETMRTLFVWLVDLMLFYGGFGLGESWSVYSWLQAAGFVVLVTGTLVYNKGNEEEYNKEISEAMAVLATDAPVMQEEGGSFVAPVHRPIAIPTSIVSAVSGQPASFKASQTIVAGSYHRGSLAGSMPRAMAGSFGGRGDDDHTPIGRGHVVTHGAVSDNDD